jgi:organic hydroperoxide reductase OsmC/OhrA
MYKEHSYSIKTVWQGTTVEGNKHIKSYDRTHTVSIKGKPTIELTTDNAAVGNPSKLNPEDLLVSAISSCHMLSYLYLCSLEGIIIHHYEDNAIGLMLENTLGGGSFKEVILNPTFTIESESMKQRAIELHHKAHEICYIANSVNFEVKCHPVCLIK